MSAHITYYGKSKVIQRLCELVNDLFDSGVGAEDFTGATSESAGTHGLVPAPQIGDQDKYLKGDGTWGAGGGGGTDFTGATASTDGTHGLVVAPMRGEQGLTLLGNGSWGHDPDLLARIEALEAEIGGYDAITTEDGERILCEDGLILGFDGGLE